MSLSERHIIGEFSFYEAYCTSVRSYMEFPPSVFCRQSGVGNTGSSLTNQKLQLEQIKR